MLHTSAKIATTTEYRKYKQEIDKSGHLIGNVLGNVWKGKRSKLPFYPSSLVFLLELPHEGHWGGNSFREVKTFGRVRAGLCPTEGGLWALDVCAWNSSSHPLRARLGERQVPSSLWDNFFLGIMKKLARMGLDFLTPPIKFTLWIAKIPAHCLFSASLWLRK